jgi:hypothetical protein
MYQNLLIGIIVVTSVLLLSRILGAWVHSKPRKHRRRKKHTGRVGHAHEYHPYESVSCEGSCEALRYMKGRRFLVRDAPKLPVHGCNSTKCHCRYVRHHDRRTGGDRRGVHGLRTELFRHTDDNDRRGDARYGRRSSDFAFG